MIPNLREVTFRLNLSLICLAFKSTYDRKWKSHDMKTPLVPGWPLNHSQMLWNRNSDSLGHIPADRKIQICRSHFWSTTSANQLFTQRYHNTGPRWSYCYNYCYTYSKFLLDSLNRRVETYKRLQENQDKMPAKITEVVVKDIRFPTSLEAHGSDAMVRSCNPHS